MDPIGLRDTLSQMLSFETVVALGSLSRGQPAV